ncbi:MAG: hypothetical protein K6G07_04085 [Lachnospiraceae bacterium]|nr:hypothetical protein [Lachnospiraceae bacterium]
MNIFEFFSNVTHPKNKRGWIQTKAVFTGRVEKAAKGKAGHYKDADYNEYEIRYMVSGKERRQWYVFYPLDDPEPDEIKGSELLIRYNKRRPWQYEAL